MKEQLINELETVREFFERSTSCLQEKDSEFRPGEGSLTVAQQVAHTAQSIEWFAEGMTRPEGFDLNFEEHWKNVLPCTSLQEARKRFRKSIDVIKIAVQNMTKEQLLEPLPEGPVMGGAPRTACIGGVSDHTAHHRGALTVYSRLLGYEPKMPYMD